MGVQLNFDIKNQIISRTDTFKVVAKSVDYLYAHFNFLTDEWTAIPTAIFRNETDAYEVIIDSNMNCLVPWEILNCEGGTFFVSVFAGDLVTANMATVRVIKSGYSDDLESSTDPTPSVYAQIMDRMADVEDTVTEAAEEADAAAERAEQAAANAGYMAVGIENGHLIYERTDQVDVDFYLDDGHLIMEGI